ncbi:hypothetical protein EU642_22315 [Salmonella enterica]|nr:hypothetical protein [Salmonella enterica]EAO0118589.1 hypothetical protein [Salmonella enterica]EAO3601692.1 hypothetical protein [Salmonella enterica]EAR6391587.1 hypothetical protein [Salmonella enterica]EAV1285351.1 hypothetical protein [Salmonella enterica]
MTNAPVTTGERLEWLAAHCERFEFVMNRESYMIVAHKTVDRSYQSAGPVADFHEAIDEAFYEVLQDA